MTPIGLSRISYPISGGNPSGQIVGGNPAGRLVGGSAAGTILGGQSEPTEVFQATADSATAGAHSEHQPAASPTPLKKSVLAPAEAPNLASNPITKALAGSGISIGHGGALLQF